MKKLLKNVVLLVFLLVALHPSLITNAAESEDVWNSWASSPSTSIAYHEAHNHYAIQDGDYLYFSTSGNSTTYGAQYETIGAKLSYPKSGDYVYLGGNGLSESTLPLNYGGIDYVIHRIPISSIYSNMPDVKAAFDVGGRIDLILDPVYSPLIGGVTKASIDGVRSKSQYAATDYASTVVIPSTWSDEYITYKEWSDTAKDILGASFNHTVVLRTPPSITRDTTPVNRGFTFLSGVLKKDLKEGDPLTGISYKNVDIDN